MKAVKLRARVDPLMEVVGGLAVAGPRFFPAWLFLISAVLALFGMINWKLRLSATLRIWLTKTILVIPVKMGALWTSV